MTFNQGGVSCHKEMEPVRGEKVREREEERGVAEQRNPGGRSAGPEGRARAGELARAGERVKAAEAGKPTKDNKT